jgi:hypothetical protein
LIRINRPESDQRPYCASAALVAIGAEEAPQGVSKMLDIIMLAIGLGFFALSVGYAMACDQL